MSFPSDEQLAYSTISEIGKLFRAGKLSPVELTQFLLRRISQLNPKLNAYLAISGEMASRQAKAAERALTTAKGKRARTDLGPLHGIPISLKDNIYTKDICTTGGSQILRDFVPAADAPVVAALKNAGAVILGKTNMHEFAYGTTSNNPHYGSVKNPWDLTRIAGGSSGGSAAALAAGLCFGSIGTDTGGSIRIPASLCGVVGVKPGLGRVNADRVIPLSTTLDFVGPLARTVDDSALLLDVIAEHGKGERTFRPVRKTAGRRRATRLGIPKDFFLDVLSPEVREAFEQSVDVLKKGGAKFKQVPVPLLQEAEDAGNQIAWAEATLYHEDAGWYPRRAAEYGEDVRVRLEMGTKVSAVTYLRALELREKFIAKFHETLASNHIDALVAPTTPITATRIGEESVAIDGKDHLTRWLLLRLNRPANLAGVPAISVPYGSTKEGLPVGLQFIGGVRQEVLLMELAADFERAQSCINRRPKFE
jgi:aspartyl-tRNA(Asn)/glutamyl-tRNA(Gln) amidotransferase subunit A